MAEYNALFTMGHILLILFLSFTFVNMQISDKRLCADKECKVVISQAKALARHIGDHPLLLTFAHDDVIHVTSKSAGSNLHLWGGEVKGQRGYFDKNYVEEIKVFVDYPKHEVNTEGDIFERLGKAPPSVDEKMRRKALNLGDSDATDVSKEKKEDTKKDSSALPDGDKDEKKDVEEHKKSNDLEDKKDENKENVAKKVEAVDDLLSMAGMLDKDSKNDNENVDHKHHDNVDGDDEEETDKEELNHFLKKKLLPGSASDEEAGDSQLEKETESLKVEPKASDVVSDHKKEEIPNVEKQKVSDESVSSKDVDESAKEDSNKVDDSSNNSKDVSDEGDGEGKQVEIKDDAKQPSKHETVEDTDDDSEVDDPTEIEDSSSDEFDVINTEAVRSESLKEEEENGKKEDKSVEDEKVSTDLHFKSEDDVSSDASQELKKEHSLEADESRDSERTHERSKAESKEEKAVSKDEVSEDSSKEADKEDYLKKESKSSEAKNVEEVKNVKKDETDEKVTSEGDKSTDETNEKIPAVEHESDGSADTPDTPSDATPPEASQKEDSLVSEKSKLESERSHKLKNTESGKTDQSSEDSPILSEQDEGKSEKESPASKSSVVDDVDQDKAAGVGSLQSSRAQLEASDVPTETPKLNINPISALISDPQPSQVDIESSKTDGHRVDATGNNSDAELKETEDLETIEEGGSTIILNKEGELVSAILPEGHLSQVSDGVALTSSNDVTSALLTDSEQLNPTAVKNILKPSQTADKLTEIDSKSPQNHSSTNTSDIQPDNRDLLSDGNIFNKDYQSSDFNSRKVLSVDSSAAALQQQQPQAPPRSQEQSSEEKIQKEVDSVIPTPAVSLPSKPNSEISSTASVNLDQTPSETLADADHKETKSGDGLSIAGDADGQIKQELLLDQQEQPDGTSKVKEATTAVPTDHMDIPPSENTVESAQTPEDTSATTEDYSADSVYHSRKINDQDLMNEDEQKFTEPSQGFFKKIVTAVERQSKDLLEKLPPSVHSLLESFGLLPNMKLVLVTFAVAILISMIVISCCSSGGSHKKLQQQLLVKYDELEKKRLIDVKEKQNLEDEIASKAAKNLQIAEEMEKLKEESKKNKSELQTLQLHNETLKKQLTSLQSQIEDLKANASSKQGEVKQQSKKTKDLEKQIKKLEERERNLEQTAQKVTSDLKHKEEEVVLLTSKIAGFTDLVGHLQTSKDQLLAEAEDWKEKVSDLKERLEQREEEFKRMQETIMFKENELEVLKDCFLQLKSFEESEEGEEDAENVSIRVQEKIALMMDVSKVNASLRALDEEKNSLANKLQIELEARQELEQQLESSRRSLETSMTDKMKAERQYQEAQTKFNVLSSYFKEKEMQLQRELGEHEALKKQNLNKLVSADEITKSAQQELDLIRTQNESLKRELASSERDFRSQIAANEKKAHENWLAARAAERELKEARHEAGVLRQKLTDIERRQFMGPGGLIRPLPTRIPPAGIMNGPPPPGMERSPSRGSLPPLPPLHMRDEDFLAVSRGDRGPPSFPLDMRRGPLPPPGMRPPLDARSPPPRMPPFGSAHSPPPRMPPPGMIDGRSPPPYDRRPPPHHMPDRRSPPFRLPPSDMLPPPLRGGPLPPHYLVRGGGGSPPMGPDSPHLDGRYPLPPYGRHPPHPADRPSPKQSKQMSPQQSQV
ncbi:hypothetical protein BsWGS_10991 [Bradybaena similaris]